MMNDLTMVPLGAAIGFCLGGVYFGGLWLTTSRLARSAASPLLVLGSFLGRLAVCLPGFYLVATLAGPIGLVSSVAGFMAAQLLLLRTLGKGKA